MPSDSSYAGNRRRGCVNSDESITAAQQVIVYDIQDRMYMPPEGGEVLRRDTVLSQRGVAFVNRDVLRSHHYNRRLLLALWAEEFARDALNGGRVNLVYPVAHFLHGYFAVVYEHL